MSNYVDSTGLNLETLTQIVTQLEDGFKAIYGADINIDPNTPDGQMINLFAQAKADLLECVAQVYASFDPDQAAGAVLDQRLSINGIKRRGATFTRTDVIITTDRGLTLPGRDTSTTPFTISDGSGTKFVLEETTTLTTGANTRSFAAELAGATQTLPNTLINIETITLGVLTVNNPSSPTTQGVAEETDTEVKIRRRQSVSLPAIGALDATQAALFAVDGVTDAIVYENVTGITDVNGIPGHSIWAIVDGGTDADVGAAIYSKRNAGCGMKGTEQVIITQANGVPFIVKFDRPVYENLFIALTITSKDVNHTIDDDYLKQQIFERIVLKIYEPADYTAITTVVKELDPLAVVTAGGVSLTAGSYVGFIYPSTIQKRFILSTTRIAITVV
jgi:uncharacterized phage protein gp47/JayE